MLTRMVRRETIQFFLCICLSGGEDRCRGVLGVLNDKLAGLRNENVYIREDLNGQIGQR